MVEQNAIVRFVGGALVNILRRTTGLLRSKNRAVDQSRTSTFHGGVNRYRCCGNAVMEKSTTKSFSRRRRGRKETSRIFYNAVSRSVRCVTAIIRIALFLSSFRSPDDRFVRSHTSSDVCVTRVSPNTVCIALTIGPSPQMLPFGRHPGERMAREYWHENIVSVRLNSSTTTTIVCGQLFPWVHKTHRHFRVVRCTGNVCSVLYGRKHNPATNHTHHAQDTRVIFTTRVFRQNSSPISNNKKPINFYFNVAQRFLSCIIFFRCLFRVFRISTDFKKQKEKTRKNVK